MIKASPWVQCCSCWKFPCLGPISEKPVNSLELIEEYVSQASASTIPLASTSGWYRGTFRQYRQTFEIPAFRLFINNETGKCTGKGWDCIGKYTLNGLCRGERLAMLKTYVIGTGDKYENKGHSVLITLRCCQSGSWGFEGAWEVSTTWFSGWGQMKINQVHQENMTPQDASQEENEYMDTMPRLVKKVKAFFSRRSSLGLDKIPELAEEFQGSGFEETPPVAQEIQSNRQSCDLENTSAECNQNFAIV
mmetsp:Transcript_19527/g.32123  ORF Transcript_19527/g.32123 Transcript_19527/m.32123 type:complete len:249 (-) Transcript_19527:2229-2975(-)